MDVLKERALGYRGVDIRMYFVTSIDLAQQSWRADGIVADFSGL
jgi:hypothetical protein